MRQGAMKRFPYVIVYEVRDDVVYINSIFNTHQHPSKNTPA